MSDAILHDRLGFAPWLEPAAWRLPGVQPLATEDWLIRDEAFAAQMQLRDRLIAEKRDSVHAITADAEDGAAECLERVLAALARDPEYAIAADAVTRPDDVAISLDRRHPLLTIGRLVQADVCLMQPGPEGHLLAGAILCFPANWTLSEKLGRPMTAIHGPVDSYDSEVARRVQRMIDTMRPGQALWRANAFLHRDAKLFAPRREADHRDPYPKGDARFIRSERQALLKLPRTEAIVFTIHTIVVPISKLTDEQRDGLAASGIRTS